MHGWHQSSILSKDFYLLSRLPGKVRMSFVIVFVLIGSNVRILIACVRNLGNRPCPRCLIPLSHVHNMGMARDMMQRETMARVDDIHRRSSVNAARRVIYEKNFQVNSTGVENMLRDMSLVPTVASYVHLLIYENNIDLDITECILRPVAFHWFQLLQNAASRYHA